MSAAVGVPILECVYILGCARWACKRCTYTGAADSMAWAEADVDHFEPIPRICRIVLAVYENDLKKPKWEPTGGYRLKVENVVKKATYEDTGGHAPPYIIYVDHEARDIVLGIRGLNLGSNKDYRVLLDDKLGKQMFDSGYVHSGLLKSAAWMLNTEAGTLVSLIQKYRDYTLTFAGHSLGSGVASLMTLLVAINRDKLGNIPRDKLRCYGIAPARCMSLNLAVQYADIINSIVLQDDFLPRTATPLEDIFNAVFCLPCLLSARCLKDTCTSEKKKLKDPRRLYIPGRIYHIVERGYCSCHQVPPEVRTGVPVDGRFEHIVLSCNATQDHSIMAIEKEAEIALQILRERDGSLDIPLPQRMMRQQSIRQEHKGEYKAALERAVTLQIPHAFSPSEDDGVGSDNDIKASVLDEVGNPTVSEDDQNTSSQEGEISRTTNWNDLVDRLFSKSKSGGIIHINNVDERQPLLSS